jgi:hypothetical protein
MRNEHDQDTRNMVADICMAPYSQGEARQEKAQMGEMMLPFHLLGSKYWIALFIAFMLILALSWVVHAEEYMVASYGAPAHHAHHHRHHQSRERHVLPHVRTASAPALATVPLPRPNPLDAPRPTYDTEAALLRFMMFGTLANVR